MNSMPKFKIQRNTKIVDGTIVEDYYLISEIQKQSFMYPMNSLLVRADKILELQKQISELKI